MFRSTQQQLQYLSMIETLHRFPIDVCDQVRRTQAGLKRWAAIIHGHHKVMHRIEVRVAIVDTNRVNCKSKTTRSSSDDDGRLEICDKRRKISAWRCIPRACRARTVASRRLNLRDGTAWESGNDWLGSMVWQWRLMRSVLVV